MRGRFVLWITLFIPEHNGFPAPAKPILPSSHIAPGARRGRASTTFRPRSRPPEAGPGPLMDSRSEKIAEEHQCPARDGLGQARLPLRHPAPRAMLDSGQRLQIGAMLTLHTDTPTLMLPVSTRVNSRKNNDPECIILVLLPDETQG